MGELINLNGYRRAKNEPMHYSQDGESFCKMLERQKFKRALEILRDTAYAWEEGESVEIENDSK
jgi:hypothetical protein